MVGALAAVDPDNGDTFTFALIDDAGGAFAVSGANLVLGKAVDYETAQSQTVTVQVTDSAGNSFEKDLTIGVTDVAPGAPTDTDGSTNKVVEGAASGTEVGITALATDVNGGAVTYSLDDDAAGRFTVDPNTGVVTVADGSGLDANLAPSHTITVRASDPSGAHSTATFDIAVVQAPNSAPTDITLSNTTIAEDSPVGAVVGALAAVDPDNGDSSTFTLINDAGGRFAVSGANLVLAKAVDYETAQSHTVTVEVTDSAGNSFEKDLTIGVTDVAPGTPTDANSDANSVVEGAASGTEVGITALASDINGGTVTYSLDDDAGGRFAIDPNTGVVTVADGSGLDANLAPSYTITVRASDPSGAYSTATFEIQDPPADPANSAPTDITLSNTTIAEDSPVGAVIGALAAADPDTGDSSTFTLINNAGGHFAVSGANLVLAKAVDYETAQSQTVTVRVTNSAGNSFEKDLTIGVTDVAPGAPTDANSEANSVVEGAASGTEVGITAHASDVNGGTVTYSLDDDAAGRFAIDPNTGVVSCRRRQRP